MLYETARTRVSRIWPLGCATSLIRKEPLGSRAVERAHHEARILRRLSSVTGVVRLAGGWTGDELVFEDAGGETLATVIGAGRVDIGQALTIALGLARIVAGVHRAGVLHKDVNPMNVLVSGPARRPMLIDFGLASTFGQEHPGFVHQREIEGTLPYLAPEQTGRTGMWVDERADLYGLGATVYELVTGRPVFAAGEPLQMIHDALTRVPVPPAQLDERVPQVFSQIIMRLLEKDPDRRYQSAEGVAHDLTILIERGRPGDGLRSPGGPTSGDGPMALGTRDFPARLSAPSRLVGRDAEVAALRSAYDRALAGDGAGVLVAGAPGVGKTALVNRLRSLVTAGGGWYVSAKFDQFRQGARHSAVHELLRGLGRLLLAGSQDQVEAARSRVRDALGANLVLAGTVPELAVLLEIALVEDPTEAVEGDAATVATRLRQMALGILRAVASAELPVVIVLDDLHWAGPSAVSFIDSILMADELAGVLLVGTYRSADVGPTHPLTTALARWERLGAAPTLVMVENLATDDLGRMLAEMLRLSAPEAADLAGAIGARTGGNPYDTLELVNALRREGALELGADGWSWDAAAIRSFVGHADVLDLLAARIERLPEAARTSLSLLACLGGQVELSLLQAAGGLTLEAIGERLLAPLEDGLLLPVYGDAPAIRFRHDRVQQAAYARLGRAGRQETHLAIARRLRDEPRWASVAAENYLIALEILDDPAERRLAAGLLVQAAASARVLNAAGAERFVGAAIDLLGDGATAIADPLLVAAKRRHHAVLYGLGRLDDADRVYDWIEERTDDPADLVAPACIQVASLTIRGEPLAAVSLGLTLLGRLGIVVPEEELTRALEAPYAQLGEWASGLVLADDLARPEASDRRTLAAATLIDRLLPASFFCDPAITAWLTLASRRAWVAHGPCGPLAANLSCATLSTIKLRGDYRTGYTIARHALMVGEARGYEPQT
ncbi:MAG: AAA family ATPase, partial [Solirubrobacteraceae bacterium]